MKHQDKDPLFSISVTAKIIGISPRVLRSYEEANLVCPYRTQGNTRLYSQQDVRRLQLIYYLHKEREVNLPGIKVILDLLTSNLHDELNNNVFRGNNMPENDLIEKIREVAPELLPDT